MLKSVEVSKCFVQHCSCCKILFCTERGLRQHCRITNCRGDLKTQPADPKLPDKPDDFIEISTYKWGEYTNKQLKENVLFIHEKIVYWKKNIFLLPTGKDGRCFIDEITRLIGAWVRVHR